MIMINIDHNLLYRYFSKETSHEENAAVGEWLRNDEMHQKEFDKELKMFLLLHFAAKGNTVREIVAAQTGQGKGRTKIFKRILYVAAAAAITAIAFLTGSYVTTKHTDSILARTMTSIDVPAGSRMDITLPDGTQVKLNSGTTLTYPVKFSGRRRNVELSGEALFNVTHNPDWPFIVSTYACDIEVLGTKFNVRAYKENNSFNVALLEGNVKVNSKSGRQAYLYPGETVTLYGGRFIKNTGSRTEEPIWTNGKLNIAGLGFSDIIREIERSFGVQIVIECAEPQINISRGELLISDGVDMALKSLQYFADFSYTRDYNTGIIHIR